MRALLLSALLAPATSPAEAPPSPVATANPATTGSPSPALEAVLPCGLRVVVARDASLPVAAVVLALDVGTRDDPEQLPGLVHALAYQLQMGNRGLAPGAAIAEATDAGGWTGMAVGDTQVRFESLVPVSRLDAILRVEAGRLRAPTIDAALWREALSYARKDSAPQRLVPAEVTAAAWGDPALGRDGRKVGKELEELGDTAIADHLGRFAAYHRASLLVVAPEPPGPLLARIEQLFADLPAHASDRRSPQLPRRDSDGASTSADPGSIAKSPRAPTPVEMPHARGDVLVWPIAPSAESRAWMQALCRVINRQVPGAEDANARLRCSWADSERRPTLHLRGSGMDVTELARLRLTRIADGSESVLVADQRAHVSDELRYLLRAPLDLAIHLARADRSAAAAPGQRTEIDLAELTGEAELARDDGIYRSIPTLLDPGAAIRLVPAGEDPSGTASDEGPGKGASPTTREAAAQ